MKLYLCVPGDVCVQMYMCMYIHICGFSEMSSDLDISEFVVK